LAVPATGPLALATCRPVVLALTAGATAISALRASPAPASQVHTRHPAQVMNI
jgi:hypothetical protein